MEFMRLLEPITFGDGRCLPCRLLPGPMDGVTEGSFVTVLSRLGCVWSWHTPFLRISTGVPSRARLREALQVYFETGLPVTVQLMGLDGGRLAATAARVLELGAVCVDLNCACPSQTVLGSDSGGARLKHLDWLADTMTRLREACGTHGFSVKVRTGFDSPEEFPRIADVLRQARPDMVIVHYRTVRELYRPVPDGLERLARVTAELPGMTVIGSGDLFTVSDCLAMAAVPGISGLAPARGLMRQPDLLCQTRAALAGEPLPAPLPRYGTLLALAEEAQRRYPPRNNGFLLRLARAMFGGDSEPFQTLVHCRTLTATIDELKRRHELELQARP